MEVAKLIRRAYDLAARMPAISAGPQRLHAERSRNFVESLATECRLFYANASDIVTFSKYHAENRADFGLNELLYDVCVCRTAITESCRKTKTLRYVQSVLLQVESEFARDSREALFDFNKLVLGSAASKVFVGPIVDDCDAFMEVLSGPATSCSGEVYAALVPAPSNWPSSVEPQFYRFNAGGWQREDA
jgi:hypothetical protein